MALSVTNEEILEYEQAVSTLKMRAERLGLRIEELARKQQEADVFTKAGGGAKTQDWQWKEMEEMEAFAKVRENAKAEGVSVGEFLASLEARAGKKKESSVTAETTDNGQISTPQDHSPKRISKSQGARRFK